MINIAVVDDEKEARDLAGDIIENCLKDTKTIQAIIHENEMEELKIDLHRFSSAREFMMYAERIRFHIVFSDVQMPDVDGIELGRYFMTKWPTACLIYLTAYSEYAYTSYRINAFQYILKNEMREHLEIVLWEAVRKIAKQQNHRIVIGTTTGQRYVNSADILYIRKEKNTKYVEYVTLNETLRDRKTLDQAVEQMQQYEFIKVERGFAVNVRHVIQLKGNVIRMRDKEEITVSRLYLTSVRQKLSEYGRKL